MLDPGTATSVVARAESDAITSPESALHLARGLLWFGASQHTWAQLGPRVVALLDRPAGSAIRDECLRTLAAVPHPEARGRLRAIALHVADPDSLTAATLVSTEYDDLVAAHIPELLAQLRARPDVDLLRTLAGLRLERYDVDPMAFTEALEGTDLAGRLWAATAAAKAGRVEPLLEVLAILADQTPDFMGGDPWSAWDMLHKAAPMPASVDEALVARRESSTGRDQRLLIGALTGRWDAEDSPVEPRSEPAPPVLRSVLPRSEADELVRAFLDATQRRDLAGLPLDRLHLVGGLDGRDAGAVVAQLLVSALEESGPETMAWCNTAMEVVRRTEHLDLPVTDLVARYVEAGHQGIPAAVLGAALARAGEASVTGAVLLAMQRTQSGDDQQRLAELFDLTAKSYATRSAPMLGAGGGGTGALPPVPAPSPVSAAPLQAPPADVAMPAERPYPQMAPQSRPRLRDRLFRRSGASSAPSGGTAHRPAGATPPAPTPAPATATPTSSTYEAFPRLDLDDVVVAREEFEVVVGLQEFFSDATAVSGLITVEDAPAVIDFEVEIVVDPKSLRITGSSVLPLTVTGADRFPSATVTLTALTAPGLQRERTVRALFRRDERIVGIAARNLVVVDTEAHKAKAPAPQPFTGHLLDLGPLLEQTPPDLVVGVYQADEPDTLLWDAYPLDGKAVIPDLDRRTRITGSAREFATNARRLVTSKAGGVAVFDNLVGAGNVISSTIPLGIRDVLRGLVAGRTTAPTVLFLTEEPFIAWELAVLNDPPLTSAYAGSAAFLGAHLAMSRWPLAVDAPPVPRPPWPQVTRSAVLTAEYDGVPNWKRLPAAEAEAKEFAKRYSGTTALPPVREDVIRCLNGQQPVDLLHVALHGQYDPSSQEDGLVLLEPDGPGFKPSFLTSLTVLGLRNTETRPFVFLNACQVGAADVVLASYAGFAAAVLATGATGVVAPLWNIDDKVAAELTDRFYTLAIPLEGSTPVPVAEILRRFRAELSRDAVATAPDELGPTQIAYQFFGHPSFTLKRAHPPGG